MSLLFALAGCAAASVPIAGPFELPNSLPQPALAGRHKIKHVVIVIQENRTVVNLFAGFPGADAPTFGFLHDGTKVNLKAVSFKSANGPPHDYWTSVGDWNNGAMNGFDVLSQDSGNSPLLPYRYVERHLVDPYWDMAQRYTLSDRMFATEWGASFTAHLDLIAGTTYLQPTVALADLPTATPWGCDAPAGTTTVTISYPTYAMGTGPTPCFNQFTTMADTLDAAGVSWKYYAPAIDTTGGIWSSFDAIRKVRYGKDWANVVSPQTTVLTDAMSGNLPAVSWVIPDWRDSDHPTSMSGSGPSWVSAVVNAVGESKDWDSTAIFVLWDDWGGWYDDAVPPKTGDYFGPGLRVPLIIISPYGKKHYVTHTIYEFGSILKFVEKTFALPTLGHSDATSADMIDSFDFTKPATPFVHIKAPLPPSHFLNETPSLRVPDEE